jgi:CheY-like chemotaxis protein
VVEDNKINQQVIVIMLRHLGLNADVANDGVEAVEALQAKNYDLILMDWQMPRMDGLEATRRIRSLSFEAKPIIIAVTANAMSGDIDKCIEAGMDDYLSKPIRREKLALTLEKWLV